MVEYKRYAIDKKTNTLILDWAMKDGKDFFKVRDYVRDVLKGEFQYRTKQWKVANVAGTVDTIRAEGWRTEEEYKAQRMTKVLSAVADFPTLPAIPELSTIKLDEQYLPSTIRSYQREAIQLIEARNGRAVIALPPGAGKTLTACSYVASKSWDKPVLLVCPAGLKTHWKNEFKKWARIKAQIIYSTFKWGSVPKNVEVLIVNFDILAKIQDELAGNISAVVVDEAHNLANDGALRTQAYEIIQKFVPYRILLTGTPVRDRPRDIYNLLKWVDPTYWRDKADFMKRYCEPAIDPYTGKIEAKGASNLEELCLRIKPFVYYKTLDEILPDMPEMNQTIFEMEVDDDAFNEESEAILRVLAEKGWDVEDLMDMDNPDAEQIAILLRIKELTRSSYFLKRSKMLAHIDDFLEETTEPLVIVANHTAVIDDLKMKYGCEAISGKVNPAHRQAIVDRFNNGETRVIVLQIIAGAEGFSLPNCKYMAFAEVNYSAKSLEQMTARIRRLTSTSKKAFYWYYCIKNSIEENMFKAISTKSSNTSMILQGKAIDFFEGVCYDVLD